MLDSIPPHHLVPNLPFKKSMNSFSPLFYCLDLFQLAYHISKLHSATFIRWAEAQTSIYYGFLAMDSMTVTKMKKETVFALQAFASVPQRHVDS